MSVTKAVAGLKFSYKFMKGSKPYDVVVKPACEQKENGQWYCVTHRQPLYNPMDKDSHIERGAHELVWVCWAHGPEVP